MAFAEVGTVIDWHSEGVDEQGLCAKTGLVLVRVDPVYFRPTEVDLLVGNPAKALKKLGWHSTTTLRELVAEMMAYDLAELRDLPRCVISGMMRQFHESQRRGDATFVCWGTGLPRWEFLHVDDLAEACAS
jgi:nucleoside-diphosphate-sugar epimerase